MEIKVKTARTINFDLTSVRFDSPLSIEVEFESQPPSAWKELLRVYVKKAKLDLRIEEHYLRSVTFANIRPGDIAERVSDIRDAIDDTNKEYTELLDKHTTKAMEIHKALDEILIGKNQEEGI